MRPPPFTIPAAARYLLAGCRVPAELVAAVVPDAKPDAEGLLTLDILIDDGRVAAICAAGADPVIDAPRVALGGRLVWPAFVDMHTHIDKGHVIPRVRPDGTIHGGFALTLEDWGRWTPADIHARMSFALACAHAHGVAAIRTHLDSATPELSRRVLEVFATLRDEWSGRVALQGVVIAPMGVFFDATGAILADLAAEYGAVLGGVTDTLERGENGTYDGLDTALDTLFALARERALPVDLHVDQTADLTAFTLPSIARARLRSGHAETVVCSHCVNLALQPADVIDDTLSLARDAALSFVSMPTPMMYLMDRAPARTPRWRGVTAAKEIMAAGLPFAVGGDNCRDAWFPYGDHDMLDTLKQAIRVFQADEPLTGAPSLATRAPADIMGLPHLGRIGLGLPANLVIFRATSLNVLLCRDQADRVVLCMGRAVTTGLPAHEDLAAALGLPAD